MKLITGRGVTGVRFFGSLGCWKGEGRATRATGKPPAIGYESQKQRGKGERGNVDEQGQVVAEVPRLTFEAITADRAQNMREREKEGGSDGNGSGSYPNESRGSGSK